MIGSDLFLFADDTKVFKSIFTKSDCDVLQDDINNMVNWMEESLKFHPDKCVTMRVGKSKLPARTYTIGPNNQEIKHVHEEKDIGVIIDDDKVKKTNSIMGLIRRAYTYLDEENFYYFTKHY